MDRKDFGFFRSIRSLSGESIFGPELLGAIVIGVGGGTALLSNTSVSDRYKIAGDFLVVLGPLLGVVFAAFALVTTAFSDRYLSLLNSAPKGVMGFLRPFLVSIGMQVGSIIWTVAYRASGSVVPSKVEVMGWLVACFLFVFAILDVVSLAKDVLAHTATRADQIRREVERDDGIVRHPRAQDAK